MVIKILICLVPVIFAIGSVILFIIGMDYQGGVLAILDIFFAIISVEGLEEAK